MAEGGVRTRASSGGGSTRATRPEPLSYSPRPSPTSASAPRGSLLGSPASIHRGLHPDSPVGAEHTRLPESPVRGSPLRPSLALYTSGSDSPSASSGSGFAAAHQRAVSVASGSDEIIGRLEFDDPNRSESPGGRGAGYARPYPPYR